jgi:peptidoglycan/xylan/chitin deacetylase (PgdA/CDA1 family)
MLLRLAKRSGLSILRASGGFALARVLQRHRVPILAYHGVLSGADNQYDYLNYNFTAAETFEQQVRYLASRFRPVTLRTVVNALERSGPLPPRSVVFTFDDGFRNNFSVAFPILQRLGVPFTVFLTTSLIGVRDAQLWTERLKRSIYLTTVTGRRTVQIGGESIELQLDTRSQRERSTRSVVNVMKRLQPADRDRELAALEGSFGRPALSAADEERYGFLSWDDVRTMARAGVEFGSHTVTHPMLATLDESTLQWELVESKREIERQTGAECYSFAYPNGSAADFGSRDQAALRVAGYSCALSLCGGLNRRDADLFALDRLNVGRGVDLAVLDAAVTGVLGSAKRARAKWAGGPRRSGHVNAELSDAAR